MSNNKTYSAASIGNATLNNATLTTAGSLPSAYTLGGLSSMLYSTQEIQLDKQHVPHIAQLKLRYLDGKEQVIDFNFTFAKDSTTEHLKNHLGYKFREGMLFDTVNATYYYLKLCSSIQILNVSSEFEKDLQDVINEK